MLSIKVTDKHLFVSNLFYFPSNCVKTKLHKYQIKTKMGNALPILQLQSFGDTLCSSNFHEWSLICRHTCWRKHILIFPSALQIFMLLLHEVCSGRVFTGLPSASVFIGDTVDDSDCDELRRHRHHHGLVLSTGRRRSDNCTLVDEIKL